ncbi:corepressor interacting with RBPJ 1-like isoform X2 [Haliotis rubra]|uniref:corepressor interacting with RBPJ 1-like isoform X2 n=1 Tax=Haliotis rubra TaxID=36100 RepID=UPI001EE5B8F4|nr:corepressor interacting with RBPJ 1-like isoform X2 [Haliotis rubra]
MGKGFNNYMTKKFFHPASKDNIKRVWMAQQKTTYEKKKQEDLMNQYQKEQEMLSNRALLGDEKAKLGLSFLYDAPPGMKKKEEDDGEQEIKFEWQRKYNAPREAYAKNDETIRDQPFGIEVRNVRCIKCRQWGHVNTDKICPLFGRNLTAEPPQPENTTSSLLESLKEDGFQMKKSIMGRLMEGEDEKKVVDTDDEDDPEVLFLKSLTPKQKKKLLKKLNKLQSKGSSMKSKKSKKEKKKKKKSKHADSDSESSDSEKRGRKRKQKTTKRKNEDSDSESSSSYDSDDPRGAYSVSSRDVRPKETRPSKRGYSLGDRSRSPLHRPHDREAFQRRSEQTRSRKDSSSEEDHKQDHRFRQQKHKSDPYDHQRKGRKSKDNRHRRHQPSNSDSKMTNLMRGGKKSHVNTNSD